MIRSQWFHMMIAQGILVALGVKQIRMTASANESYLVTSDAIDQEPVWPDMDFPSVIPLATQLVIAESRFEMILAREAAHCRIEFFEVMTSPACQFTIFLKCPSKPRSQHGYC